jgi:hypothetical protein
MDEVPPGFEPRMARNYADGMPSAVPSAQADGSSASDFNRERPVTARYPIKK